MSQAGEARRVAIVGGGIAGLSAAYELSVGARERGLSPSQIELFESSARLGGAILTERADGYVLDAGPDRGASWVMAVGTAARCAPSLTAPVRAPLERSEPM